MKDWQGVGGGSDDKRMIKLMRVLFTSRPIAYQQPNEACLCTGNPLLHARNMSCPRPVEIGMDTQEPLHFHDPMVHLSKDSSNPEMQRRVKGRTDALEAEKCHAPFMQKLLGYTKFCLQPVLNRSDECVR